MLACEENSVDAFYNDLKAVNDVFASNAEYAQLLLSPGIPKAERLDCIESVFGGRINGHILSFVQLLCENGKIAELSVIFAEFEKLKEWASKTAEAVAVSAVELSDTQKQRLVSVLEKKTGKRIILKTVIDKSVLGGLTVTLDGEIIDGSVKTGLKRVREVIGSE